MKVRAMRVRARPGQRRMVAKHGYWKALDEFAIGTVQAMVDSHNNFVEAVNGMMKEVILQAIKPIVEDVVRYGVPALSGRNSISGGTSSAFAARKWSGQP